VLKAQKDSRPVPGRRGRMVGNYGAHKTAPACCTVVDRMLDGGAADCPSESVFGASELVCGNVCGAAVAGADAAALVSNWRSNNRAIPKS